MVRPEHQQASNADGQQARNAQAKFGSRWAVDGLHLDHVGRTSDVLGLNIQQVRLAWTEIINHDALRVAGVGLGKPGCARGLCAWRFQASRFNHANVTDRDARIVFPRIEFDCCCTGNRRAWNDRPGCAGRIVLAGRRSFWSTVMALEHPVCAQQHWNLIKFGAFQGVLERFTQAGGGDRSRLGQVQQV